MVKERRYTIRLTKSDLQAARDEADRLGVSLSQVYRILSRAFSRGWLDIRDYMTEPKPSITRVISDTSLDGGKPVGD